jgi:prefoldin subunit 2
VAAEQLWAARFRRRQVCETWLLSALVVILCCSTSTCSWMGASIGSGGRSAKAGAVAPCGRSPRLEMEKTWVHSMGLLPKLVLRGGEGGDEGKGVEPEEDKVNRDRALIQQLQAMRGELSSMAERIGAIEGEIEEHNLAVDVLKDYDDSRLCHRAVGGVLMEQTVGTVRPALASELDMLGKAHSDLQEKIRKTEEAILKFQNDNGIKVVKTEGAASS